MTELGPQVRRTIYEREKERAEVEQYKADVYHLHNAADGCCVIQRKRR